MTKEETRNLLLAFFFEEEEEAREHIRLTKLLEETVVSSVIYNRVALIQFKNGIVILIELYDCDAFKLIANDLTIYQNEDTPISKLSKDRILYYLDYVANIVYMGL